MSKNQVPVGHIHTHSPQLPWINKKTKTWWIGNHDTKQPYRGVKGDSVKGDTGDRGNGWFLLSSSTDVSPEGAITDDLIMNSGTGDIMVAGVIVEPGEYVQVLSVNPFQVTDVLGSLKGPKGTEGDTIVGPPGNSLEIRYAKNKDPENAPALNRSDRNPEGWSIETINPETDEFVWETRGYVDWEDNLVGTWSNPFRNTGVGIPGQDGAIGDGVFKSTVFTVSPTQPATPTGGTWLDPVPTTPGWHDGIPDEDGPRWMSTRIFTLSGTAPQQSAWTTPMLLADSSDIDFEFSSVEIGPGDPASNPENWTNNSDENSIWMAVRKYSNGSWGDWEVSKIKGEKGVPGQDGQPGDGIFKSSVFNVSPTKPSTPTGGTWASPIPTTSGWSDGIPDEDGPRWISTRIFTFSGNPPQEPTWSEPVLLADSADVDFEFSSVETNPGNPTDNPANWSNDSGPDTIWMAVRKYANGAWGEWQVSRIKGEEGDPGTDGQDGQDGTGYEFQYTVTNRGDSPPSISNDAIWSSTFPGAIDSSQTLWYRQRTVTGTSTGAWVGPIRMSGSDGETIEGPSMAYRGDWSAIQEYSGTNLVVDVVKYAGLGYIARTDAGEIPVGALPTDTNYWNEFTENIDSLFTDFLFAYSGYIQNLTVGQIATGVEPDEVPDPDLAGRRTTIGFMPTAAHDPTSNLAHFDRDGIRQYHPSGRIAAYMGQVNNYTYPTEVDGVPSENTVNGWAIITFQDLPGSPVMFKLDIATTQGIKFAKEGADIYTPANLDVVKSGTGNITQNDIDNFLRDTTKVVTVYAKVRGNPEFLDWDPKFNTFSFYKEYTSLYNFQPGSGSSLHPGITVDTAGTYFNGYIVRDATYVGTPVFGTGVTQEVNFRMKLEIIKYVNGVNSGVSIVMGDIYVKMFDAEFSFNPPGPFGEHTPQRDGQTGRAKVETFTVTPAGDGTEDFQFSSFNASYHTMPYPSINNKGYIMGVQNPNPAGI